jgi:hypothetical protein
MLYCPKCQRTYEEGTQRFCTDDSARLLPSSAPSSSAKNANSGGRVFTNIFNRAAHSSPSTGDAESSSSATSFKQGNASRTLREAFRVPPTSKMFKPEAKVKLEVEKSAKTQARTEILTAASVGAASGASAKVVGERAKDNAAGVKRTKIGKDLSSARRPNTGPAASAKTNWAIPGVFGALIALSSFGLWYFLPHHAPKPYVARNAVSPANNNAQQQQQPTPETVALETTPPSGEIESQPPRTILPPENFVYFENSRQNLKGNAAKNFLGFSLYFPKNWKKNDAENNFLDVSKNTSSGTPVEQMLVSFYDSRGTFGEDQEIFPLLVDETSRKLNEIVPKFEIVSRGETTINSGWRAYEVKFVGAGKTGKGEDIELWGRRLFVPAGRGGVKNGYVLTLLATSFSPEVKSVDDVGVKGDLNRVLETFEPSRDF